MVKQLILPFLGVFLFIALVGYYTQKSPSFKINQTSATSTPSVRKTLIVGNSTLEVELANTPSLRSSGLSGRNAIEENYGMLFVFESQNTKPGFWMKDMLIPIDIIWIENEKVVQIDNSVQPPAPNTLDNKLQIYSPVTAIDYVLEVKAGFSQKHGLKIGDSVVLPTL